MDEPFWILFFINLVAVISGRDYSFAVEWRGTWYQSSLGEIQITSNSISNRGVLVRRFQNKYILWNKDKNCYTCLVFTPQHENLLQYKESMCYTERPSTSWFLEVCGTITGDDVLYTVVKVTSIPVPCPFQGQYSFTYYNGLGRCRSPVSEIHACADESRFKIHTKHCPAVPDTYDRVTNFQCLATWDNGGNFLYGKFTGAHIQEKEDMYRCFVYEIYGNVGYMAMSADATCLGLQNPSIGLFTWELTTENKRYPHPSCTFSEVFNHKNIWRDINGKYIIELSKDRQSLKLKSVITSSGFSYSEEKTDTIMTVKCADMIQEYSSTNEIQFLAHTTNDTCSSYAHCIRMKRRSRAVLEISFGSPLDGSHPSCTDTTQWLLKLTMFPENIGKKTCPQPGNYIYENARSQCEGVVRVSCENDDEIVFESECPPSKYTVDYWQCLHTWSEDGRTFLLAQKPGDKRKIGTCMTFTNRGSYIEYSRLPGCSSNLAPSDIRDTLQLNVPPVKCMKTTNLQSDEKPDTATESVGKHIITDTRGNTATRTVISHCLIVLTLLLLSLR